MTSKESLPMSARVGSGSTFSAGSTSPKGLMQCEDFLQFEHALRETRAIDDKIVQALNNSIPTASFKHKVDSGNKCKDLWRSIESTYNTRAGAINRCIVSTEARLEAVRADGGEVKRQDKTALRLLRAELSVEDVIRNRTQEVFHVKCRDHVGAPDS